MSGSGFFPEGACATISANELCEVLTGEEQNQHGLLMMGHVRKV
jgi:hypothetical protein